jgi:hypothetical protein
MVNRWTTPARRAVLGGVVAVAGVAWPMLAQAPRMDVFVDSREHPAIGYAKRPSRDPIAELDQKLQAGGAQLAFDAQVGYVRSTLDALRVPASSQTLVLSQTSQQADMINPKNPRAIYFNDNVAVAWVRGADALELAAQDREQGVVFYTLSQIASPKPRFTRDNGCLLCHATWDNLGVPGMMTLTTFPMPDDPNAYASGFTVDHRTPLDQRWGGWYVTHKGGAVLHAGNVPVIVKKSEFSTRRKPTPQLASVAGVFDTKGYLSPYSDIVALMVLDHQTRMTNLMTRAGWEARVAGFTAAGAAPALPKAGSPGAARIDAAATELVDYLLFVDEAPLPGRLEGPSSFATDFAALGPRDSKGRSLRQFDLERRLMRYACSYMIYAPAFDALPPAALDAVYQRLWKVLSGEVKDKAYAHLTLAARQAVVEILRETKPSLPGYFKGAVR